MNDIQVAETVKLILTEYYFLKLEDLKLCFNGMKSGKYIEGGKLFDRLDGQIILSALSLYNEERQEVFRITEEKEKEARKEKEERYFVKIGENYLRESDEVLEEISEKELASTYSYKEAMRKKELLDCAVKDAKITVVFSEKSEIGLIDHIKKAKPELATELTKEKFVAPKRSYDSIRLSIMADDSLTDLQKENKIRDVAGLGPVTQKEFDIRQELLKKTIEA